MTKYNQLPQAERMYIYDRKSLAEIGAQLGLSRRILFYWKKKYNWDKKRFELEYEKENFSKELLDFALNILNWSFDLGWDKEYDGLLYFVDVENKPVQALEWDMKLWWPHNETVIASLMFYLYLTFSTVYLYFIFPKI